MIQHSKQSKMIRRYRWLILLLSGIIIGGDLIYAGLIKPVIKVINLTPRPLSMYSSDAVEEVCDILRINPDDPFCVESDQQNAGSLEKMLERNFPVGRTKFDDIMPLLANLPSETSREGADFEPNGCQIQTFPEDRYECYVVFPGEINIVTIAFTGNDGVVISYSTTRMGT